MRRSRKKQHQKPGFGAKPQENPSVSFIGYYVTQTEGRAGRDYCDVLMLVRNDKRHYQLQDFLFEFKYLSLATLDKSGQDVRALQREEATALPQVQEALAQAESAITQYVPNVLAQHSEITNLRCYAIVSLGYDKLVWYHPPHFSATSSYLLQTLRL